MRREDAHQVTVASSATVAVAQQPGADSGAVAPAHLAYVDGLRALAALYVVANHVMKEVWLQADFSSVVARQIANPLQYAHFAVSVFIVLSGFSLMLPVARKGYRLPRGARDFYWRRARRILPPYYFAMSLSLLLIWLFIGHPTGTHWDNSLPVTWRDVLQHVLLVNDFALNGGEKINFVFWSIAMECQIYLLFPALIILWRRYSPLRSMILVVVLSLILMYGLAPTWIGHLSGYLIAAFAPQYIGLFAMGMFAASVYTTPTPRWLRWRDMYLWDALAVLSAALMVLRISAWPVYLLDLVVGAGTVGLLLAASRPAYFNLIRGALEWQPLVWMGGISYSIYLIHAPLIQLIWQYGLHPLGWGDIVTYLALLAVGLPLIVAASWVFWYCCERPFLNSRNSRDARAGAWVRRVWSRVTPPALSSTE